MFLQAEQIKEVSWIKKNDKLNGCFCRLRNKHKEEEEDVTLYVIHFF